MYNTTNYNTYSPNNAKDIMDEILSNLAYMVDNNLPGIYILKVLDRMEFEKKISFVGDGSNRIAIEINADMRPILNDIGFLNSNMNVVVKVPFNVFTGSKDNRREEVIFDYMQRIAFPYGKSGESDAISLAALVPESHAYDIANAQLLVQEELIPIERSDLVMNLLRTNNMEYTEENLGDAVLAIIKNDKNLFDQMNFIMNTMDKYFVMADLNIMKSRFNFGFKMAMDQYGNKRAYLAPLDLGYALPRIFPDLLPKCPECGRELHYVHIGCDMYNASEERKKRLNPRLMLNGLYSCMNEACTYNGTTGDRDPYTVDDMQIFHMYESAVRDLLRSNPNIEISALLRSAF